MERTVYRRTTPVRQEADSTLFWVGVLLALAGPIIACLILGVLRPPGDPYLWSRYHPPSWPAFVGGIMTALGFLLMASSFAKPAVRERLTGGPWPSVGVCALSLASQLALVPAAVWGTAGTRTGFWPALTVVPGFMVGIAGVHLAILCLIRRCPGVTWAVLALVLGTLASLGWLLSAAYVLYQSDPIRM